MSIVEFIRTLRKHQDTPSGYVAAFIVMALAIAIREAIDPYVKIPYVTLFPAMIICSLVGGRLAGILAAVFGGLVAWYFWLPPRRSFTLDWPSGQLTAVLYVATSWILLLLTRGVSETLKSLEAQRDLSAELFRELQHRTANNLLSVSAMLRHNRKEIERDPAAALEVLDAASQRFEIMSRINRRLYSPEKVEIEAAALLRELCEDMRAAFGAERIVCDIRPSTVRLERERAMLVSLLVAELLMNANKHAFGNGRSGKIEISIEPVGGQYRLTVTDDGTGYEADAGAPGLGTRIMQGLVAQCRGTMRTASGPGGTTVEIDLPAC